MDVDISKLNIKDLKPVKYKLQLGVKIVIYLGGAMESSFKMFRGISAGMIILEEANLLHENTITEAKRTCINGI